MVAPRSVFFILFLIFLLSVGSLQVGCTGRSVGTTQAAGEFVSIKNSAVLDAESCETGDNLVPELPHAGIEDSAAQSTVQHGLGGAIVFGEENGVVAANGYKKKDESQDQLVTYRESCTEMKLYQITKELSREEFAEKVGQTYIDGDPVLKSALRIAEISLNRDFLLADHLENVELLSLSLFDNESLQVLIDNTYLDNSIPSSVSLRGKPPDFPAAVFFFSMTGVQVLATLRLPDRNLLYTLKYIHPLEQHYLFMAQITEVEQYECEVRIPTRIRE